MAEELNEPNQTKRPNPGADSDEKANKTPPPEVAGALFEIPHSLKPMLIQQ
jgi:hypothetical protein